MVRPANLIHVRQLTNQTSCHKKLAFTLSHLFGFRICFLACSRFTFLFLDVDLSLWVM